MFKLVLLLGRVFLLMAGVKSNPADAASKWRDNLTQSTTRIAERVSQVRESPGAAAARSADLWQRKVTQARDKFARGVGRVSLSDWQRSMTEVGIPRIADGASKKVDKVEAFHREFLPYLDQGVQRVQNMPKGSLADSIARASAMIEHNSKFRRSGSGS